MDHPRTLSADQVEAALRVLHAAFAILQRSHAAASQPPFLSAHSLTESLRIAAGSDLEAFHAAALLLARVLGAASEEGTGGSCLERALAAWCQKRGVPVPTADDALGLIVQAIAVS